MLPAVWVDTRARAELKNMKTDRKRKKKKKKKEKKEEEEEEGCTTFMQLQEK